jgi:hypothetical protein
MPTKRKTAAPTRDPAVSAFLDALEHPCRDEIAAARDLILAVDPTITDGIKWNSASFKTTEFFATVNWRYKAGVQIVLHRGAKARKDDVTLKIDDPAALLEWRDRDRALLTIPAGELKRHAKPLQAIIRQWIAYV